MAHQTEIVINGVSTEVTEFDHSAQEIDDGIDKVNTLTGEDIPTSASDPTSISSQLSNKLDKISSLLSGTDLNTVRVSGNYRLAGDGDGFANTPPNVDVGWCLMYVVGDTDTVSQTLYVLGGDRWGRMLQSGNFWSEWRKIATATPPDEYDIPFRSGWQANVMKATYCKSQEGICIVNCAVYGTGTASDNFIATLPEGFRPSGTICCAAHAYKDGVRGIAEAQINAYGDIVIYSPIEFDFVSFSCAFVAGN